MFEFEKPKLNTVEKSSDKKYARFVIEPLERGYGITLGSVEKNYVIFTSRSCH